MKLVLILFLISSVFVSIFSRVISRNPTAKKEHIKIKHCKDHKNPQDCKDWRKCAWVDGKCQRA